MKRISLKKRRGLHTIIGAVFFVLVMGSTISYVTYSMGLVDKLAYQIDTKQDNNLNRQSEQLTITNTAVVNNEFNLTVQNTGFIPINVTKMWAKNMTDSTWNQTSYAINKVIAPGASLTDVGIGTGLKAIDSESYALKLLTTRGNAVETHLLSASNLPLEMSLFTIPVDPLDNQDVTIQYTVKNNLTNGATIQSLTPQLATSGAIVSTPQSGPTPASYQGLTPGESVTFKWIYEVTGDEDDTETFTASLLNGVAGNDVSDTVTLDVAPTSYEALESELSKSFGKIFLNFTTFEACIPTGTGAQDCTSDSSDWSRAWELTKNRDYQYRIEMRNTGDFDFWLDKHTSLMMLQAGDAGGTWDYGDTFYIIEENTPSDEGTNSYADFSEKIPKNDGSHTVYFGAYKPSNSQLETIFSETGILSISVLVYASEDTDENGHDGNDPRYSQNMPFQAISTK